MKNDEFIKNLESAGTANNRGFTLLELLISMTLLSLIFVIIFGAMRLATRSVDSGEKKIAFLERTRASMRIIDSQIQSLLPVSSSIEGEKTYRFTGEQDTLQFPTNYSVLGRQRGYVMATYKVVTSQNNEKALYLNETQMVGETEESPEIPDMVAQADKDDTVKLFDGFYEISFKFYKKELGEEEGEWVDTWEDEESVPERIQLHISRDRIEDTIIIPVRVAASLKKDLTITPK